jgi:hypothetical protein
VKSNIPALNLVVNCAARKRSAAEEAFQIGNYKSRGSQDLARLWTSALDSGSGNLIKAVDLYCGGYWSTIRSTVEHGFQGERISLFIASAGYGLLNAEELILPYSATFARGLPDSIGCPNTSRDSSTTWWESLKTWRHASGKTPSSLSTLALSCPVTPLLVAVSAEYFQALTPDLLSARDALSDPDLLMIVSTGVKNAGKLGPNLLPTDARIEHLLGGVRSSLNALIVRHILGNISKDELLASRLAPILKQLHDEQPPIRTFDRAKMDDDSVLKFIRHQLAIMPEASFSILLRELRKNGHACEHKRFRGLFRSVIQSQLEPTTTA